MRFYLTTHEPGWLKRPEMAGGGIIELVDGRSVELADGPVPLFVSRHRLARIEERGHKLPRSVTPWALDSGGFGQLAPREVGGRGIGSWEDLPVQQYVDEVRRYADEIGMLEWAAPQDWMCEPEVLGFTSPGQLASGLSLLASHAHDEEEDDAGDRELRAAAREWGEAQRALDAAVLEHQFLTIENFVRLRHLAPDLPWAPVLQGWNRRHYLTHVELYRGYGVDLTSDEYPVVGVGSVCRKAEPAIFLEMASLFDELRRLGIPRLHAFGFKTQGLLLSGGVLASADSLAWSQNAFKAGKEMRALFAPGDKEVNGALPGHADPGFIDAWSKRMNRHQACSNCIIYALLWRARLLWRLAEEGEPHWEAIEHMTGIAPVPELADEHYDHAPEFEPPVPAALVRPNRKVGKRQFEEYPRPGGAPVEGDDEAADEVLMGEQLKLWRNTA